MFGSGYENCPEFGVLGGVFLSSIFCKQEDKLLFFGSVSGCTRLILSMCHAVIGIFLVNSNSSVVPILNVSTE